MHHIRLVLLILIITPLFLSGTLVSESQDPPTQSTATPAVAILSPLPGQVLQGNIPIVVFTAIEYFQSADLEFSYTNHPTNTWFLIFQSNQPITNQEMTQWDTSLISDGIYNIRLTVTLSNGNPQIFLVTGLRVRNYTPVETETPTTFPPTATSQPGETPTPSITPTFMETPILSTSTSLPSNPVQLSSQDVLRSVGKGVLAVCGLFALAGLYQTISSIRKRE